MLRLRSVFSPRRTIPLLATLGLSLVLLSSDLFVPLMPSVAKDFAARSDLVQMTLSAQFLGTSLFAMIAGPLSDYMGRRFVIMSCLVAFLCCATGCALATDIYKLILFRFLQGCSASGVVVTSLTLIKDIFPTLRGTRIITRLMLISILSPALGPILGGHISTAFGWRAIFYAIVVLSFVVTAINLFLLPETNAKARAHRGRRKLRHFSFKKVLNTYSIIYQNRNFIQYAVAHGSMFSGKWCFVSVAPFIYMETLKVPKDTFGYYLASLAIFFAIFQYFAGIIVKRFTQVRLMQMGLVSGLLSAFLFLFTAYFYPFSPIALSLAISLYFGSIAWVAPPAASLALMTFHSSRGAASSAISNFRTLMGFVGATMGSLLTNAGFVYVGIFLIFTVLIPLMLTLNAKEA